MHVGFIAWTHGVPHGHQPIRVGHSVVAHTEAGALWIASSRWEPGRVQHAGGCTVGGHPRFLCPDAGTGRTDILGPEGAIEGARAGQIFIDTSTIYPMTSQKDRPKRSAPKGFPSSTRQ